MRKVPKVAVCSESTGVRVDGHWDSNLLSQDGLLLRVIRTIDEWQKDDAPFKFVIPRKLQKALSDAPTTPLRLVIAVAAIL